MSATEDSFDAATMLADDALLDALAAGDHVENDPLGALLTRWRAEVVRATPAYTHTCPYLQDDQRRPRRRLTRVAAAAVATVGLITSGGVAAAAVTGPRGPLGGLHRMIFGDVPRADPNLARVIALLDEAQRRIATGQHTGEIVAAEHDAIADILNRAEDVLSADTSAPRALVQRLQALQADLARLPITPSAAPSAETPAPGGPGSAPTRPPLPLTPPHTHPGAAGTTESDKRDPDRSSDTDSQKQRHNGSADSNGAGGSDDTGSDDSQGSTPDSGSGSDNESGSHNGPGSDSGDGSGDA